MDQGGSDGDDGGGKKVIMLEYIWEVEPTELADGPNVWHEEIKGVRNNANIFGLNNYKN